MSDECNPKCPPIYYSLNWCGQTNYSSFYIASRIKPRSKKKFFIKCISLKNYTLKIEQECGIQSSVKHPNIMPLNDHFEFEHYYYLEMPLAVGPISNDLIINVQQIYKIMFQVSHAVYYLHEQNILHGDINPNNMVLMDLDTKNPLPRIIDFGFAQQLESSNSYCSCHHMTLDYSAPEVLGMENHSFPSDIWSLGATFYYMITHRKIITETNRPYKALQIAAKNRILDFTNMYNDPRNFGTYFANSGKLLIDRMLDVDPSKRPTAKNVIEDPFFDEVLDQAWINDIRIKYLENTSIVPKISNLIGTEI